MYFYENLHFPGFLKPPPHLPDKNTHRQKSFPDAFGGCERWVGVNGVSGGWVWAVWMVGGCERCEWWMCVNSVWVWGLWYIVPHTLLWITWVNKVKMAITENLQKWRTQTFWKFRRMYDYGFVEKTLVRSNQSQIPYLLALKALFWNFLQEYAWYVCLLNHITNFCNVIFHQIWRVKIYVIVVHEGRIIVNDLDETEISSFFISCNNAYVSNWHCQSIMMIAKSKLWNSNTPTELSHPPTDHTHPPLTPAHCSHPPTAHTHTVKIF